MVGGNVQQLMLGGPSLVAKSCGIAKFAYGFVGRLGCGQVW